MPTHSPKTRKKGKILSPRKTATRKGRSSKWKRPLFFMLKLLLMLIAISLPVGFLAFKYYSMGLPDISEVYTTRKQPTFTILDRSGKILANYGDLYGRELKFEQFPKHLIDAIIAVEDRRFFTHSGIDMWGILRAVYRNKIAGKVVQGGSTITQQLAKIAFLTPEKTLKRKIQEALLARELEKKYSKKEIMSLYLNKVYMGRGNFGIDAAAKFYFGKRAEQLTLYECAVLAGMLKAPSKYAPSNNHELSLKRARLVLELMEEAGYISSAEEREAIPPKIMQRGYARGALQNPYFTDYVLEQLPLYVTDLSRDLKIYTTLDTKLQQQLETVISINMKDAKKKLDASEAAGVAISTNGEIKAMVGGVSYTDSQFNRAVNAKRQPGSAFKLFVYLAALENGYTPDTIVEDKPITIGKWSPRNLNRRYLGEMTLETAFAKSVNTVAVALSEEVGREKVIQIAQKLGITDTIKDVPSIALGSSVTSLLAISGAYAAIANGGEYITPHAILKITDKSGHTLYRFRHTSNTKLESKLVQQIRQLLRAVILSGTGRKAANNGALLYGKTGTTQDHRDASFIGFSDDLTLGIWVGNDDNSAMKRVTGGGIAAQIWSDFMEEHAKRNHDNGIFSHIERNKPLQENNIFSRILGINNTAKADIKIGSGTTQ